MKITIEKTEKTEFEVTFPVYKKKSIFFYKLEENKTTVVLNSNKDYSIEIKNHLSHYPFQYDETTEQEFNEAYNQVKSKL